jgi:hypothetical protein
MVAMDLANVHDVVLNISMFATMIFANFVQSQRKRRKQWQYENGAFGQNGSLGIKRIQSRNS